MSSFKFFLCAIVVFFISILNFSNVNAFTQAQDVAACFASTNTQVYEYIDGHLYLVTYDDDGKMIDMELLD
ncbi:MAG: hypothetical protein K1X86_04315 [Ignavibacteria bacterium]|nr:hypothetical protein [Ignavibacteria bacterium]